VAGVARAGGKPRSAPHSATLIARPAPAGRTAPWRSRKRDQHGETREREFWMGVEEQELP